MNLPLLLAGLGAGFCHSLYSAVSKSLLNDRGRHPLLFMVCLNVSHALVSVPLWLIAAPAWPGASGMGTLAVACTTSAVAYWCLYMALSSGDASSVMPVMGSKVIFGSVWAVFLLGEVHGTAIYGAMVLVALSIGALGYSPSEERRERYPLKPLLYMLASSMIFGLTDIYIKRSLAYLDTYNFLVYYNGGIAFLNLPVLLFLKKSGRGISIGRGSLRLFGLAGTFLLASTLLLVVSFNVAGGVVIPNILMASRGVFIVLISAGLTLRGGTMLDKQKPGIYLLRFCASLLIILSIWITLKA